MNQIYYLTTELERALGVENILLNYHILFMQPSQLADSVKNNGIPINQIQPFKTSSGQDVFSSSKILQNKEALEIINTTSGKPEFQADIISFKANSKIDSLSNANGYRSVNPFRKIHHIIGNKSKMSDFISYLGFIKQPKYQNFDRLDSLNYNEIVSDGFGFEFYLQFITGQSGKGTYRITTEYDLESLKKLYPLRAGRISVKINGSTITVNGCATGLGVIIGGISEQITGIEEFTSSVGGSVGNDFSQRNLSDVHRLKLINIVSELGSILYQHGFKGIFGVDFVFSRDDNEFYLIEVNPRQVQSSNYYSYLQQLNNQVPISLFHLLELIGHDYSERFYLLQPEVEESVYKSLLNLKNTPNLLEYNIRNNQPIQASQVIFRNNTLNDIRILDNFPSGIFRIRGRLPQQSADIEGDHEHYLGIFPVREDAFSNLCMLSRGYNIMEAHKLNGLLIDISPSGSKIAPHVEYGRMQFLDSAFSSSDSNHLKGWIIDIFETIKDNCRIIEVKDLNQGS